MEGEDLNKLIDRYEAVRARAERCEGPEQAVARKLLQKMETNHPGLGEFAKKREEAARFREMFQKQTGMDPWGENWQEASRAANGQAAPPDYKFVDKVLWKAMGWATRNLQEMMTEDPTEDSQPFSEPTPRAPDTEPWVEPTPRSLLEEISAEVETETSAYRDQGEDVVEVTLWFPRRLWEKIVREEEGGRLLVRWVARVMEGER